MARTGKSLPERSFARGVVTYDGDGQKLTVAVIGSSEDQMEANVNADRINKELPTDEEDDIGKLSKSVLDIVMKRKSMTPGDVCQLLDVSDSYVSLVRGGKRNLRLAHLAKLADVAGIPLQLLLAQAMPIDAAKVPKHLRTALKKYESLLADGAKFLRDFEESRSKGKS